MYQQIKPTEVFRERELALIEEGEYRRLARRLRTGREPKGRSTKTALLGFLASLVVAGLMLAASSVSAHASTTTFTVNLPTDVADASGADGLCDVAPSANGSQCTLRAAIEQANATPGANQIAFKIPGTGGHTITPNSSLPSITERVTIDGYTQPGASPNTKTVGDNAVLRIELDGSNLFPQSTGLHISNVSNSVIRGLVINRFGTGITITGLADAVGNRIEGNFIGPDRDGNGGPGNHFDGVFIYGPSEAVVGGSKPEKRNIISCNSFFGVDLLFSDATRIQGNYLGTEKGADAQAGTGNGYSGVLVGSSSGVTVGGKTTASGNVISDNQGNGLVIDDSDGTKVLGNRIGTTATGISFLRNAGAGIQIVDSSTNSLIGDGTAAGSNTIAFNGQDGVDVDSTSTGNKVSRNSIFSNGFFSESGLGIDLLGPGEDSSTNIPTRNDTGDKDTGANNLQNRPAITSAKTVSGKTTLKGTLNSTPNQTFTIQFFSNPNGTNEGKQFIGEKSVTTRADGLSSFTLSPTKSVAAGQTITATATRVSTGDTSEFSLPSPRAVVTS